MKPVIVLCGGLGKRLRSVISDRPKVLAPIKGKPFLYHLLTFLHQQGVGEVFLSTGYLAEQVDAYINDREWPLSVRTIREEQPLGTGGAILHVLHTTAIDDTFIAMNGDTFFSGALQELLAFHHLHQANASLALAQADNPARFGRVNLKDSRIQAFEEKRADLKGPAWINAGVYALEPIVFAAYSFEHPLSIERDIFPQWVGRGLYGCRFAEARFLDIGTPEDLKRAESVFENRQLD